MSEKLKPLKAAISHGDVNVENLYCIELPDWILHGYFRCIEPVDNYNYSRSSHPRLVNLEFYVSKALPVRKTSRAAVIAMSKIVSTIGLHLSSTQYDQCLAIVDEAVQIQVSNATQGNPDNC